MVIELGVIRKTRPHDRSNTASVNHVKSKFVPFLLMSLWHELTLCQLSEIYKNAGI